MQSPVKSTLLPWVKRNALQQQLEVLPTRIPCWLKGLRGLRAKSRLAFAKYGDLPSMVLVTVTTWHNPNGWVARVKSGFGENTDSRTRAQLNGNQNGLGHFWCFKQNTNGHSVQLCLLRTQFQCGVGKNNWNAAIPFPLKRDIKIAMLMPGHLSNCVPC